jgi:hypothetical protein
MRNWHGNLSPFGSWHTGRRVFNPLSLFANGEPGVWFDPSPTTTFTDTAGTTPATVASAVALMLDKSKGLVLGPELVTNGDFSNGTTGWSTFLGGGGTFSVSDGSATFTRGALNDRFFQSLSGPVAVRSYVITFTILAISGGDLRVSASATSAENANVRAIHGTTGPKSFLFQNDGTLNNIVFTSSANGASFSIDNISVKELPGNHATQATTAARPILARVPARGRVNLLQRTEEFDNAAWVKGSGTTITPNAASAPDGSSTADRVINLNAGAGDRVIQQITIVDSTLVASIWLKGEGSDVGKNVSLSAKRVGGTFTGAEVVHTLTGDWVRVSVSFTQISGNTGATINLVSPSSNSATEVLIWGAQLELGSTATNYQRVTNQFDVTEAGQADNYYLFHGGSADPRWMITPTITPGIDKVQVFAGVRKLSDAAQTALVGLSASPGGNAGVLEINAPGGGLTVEPYALRSRGTANSFALAPANSFNAPITNVLTGIGDIAGDNATLRVNGTQVAQSTADQGTGNFLAYPLYIGARAGTIFYFNGQLYSLIARFGPNLDVNTIERTERYVASKTAGVSIP